MVAVIFGRIILRRNRQIISHLSLLVLEGRPEHSCEGTASEFLSFEAMVFLCPAPDSRKNLLWAVWSAGKSSLPPQHVTTHHSGAPDTSAPFVSASDAHSFWSRHPRGAARHDWHPVGGVMMTSLTFQLMPCRVHFC